MSNSYLIRMPIGVPGHVTRPANSTIESALYNASKPFGAYGVACKFVAGKIEPVEASDAASVIVGWLVRSYPTSSSTSLPIPTIGNEVPVVSQTASLLRRGYINVKVSIGTPAFNGIVYVRVVAASGKLVGDIEATADGSNNVVVPTAKFRGPADANGVTEIEYNL